MLLAAPFLVATEYMVADVFTKATDKGIFFSRCVIRNRSHKSVAGTQSVATNALSKKGVFS